MDNTENWYIVKTIEGQCEIIPSDRIEGKEESGFAERWGPFASQGEAIARRVGLIRVGKCQPM